MKGDIALDVHCPVGCSWVGHPRSSTIAAGKHRRYTTTPETTARHSVYQHLLNAHPELTVRERSLLVAEAVRSMGIPG